MPPKSKLFYDNRKWQRFVHFVYVNDCTVSILSENENCEKNLRNAMRYAYLSQYLIKIKSSNITKPLQNIYLDVLTNNLNYLRSLKDQNSKTLEQALAEFNAPNIHKKIKYWQFIFQSWKEVYKNPQNFYFDTVCNTVQNILYSKEITSVPSPILNLGLKTHINGEIRRMLLKSLQCKQIVDVIKLLVRKTVLEENINLIPYERGNAKFLFLTENSKKYRDETWDIPCNNFPCSSYIWKPLDSQLITIKNECFVKNEDFVATTNLCLTKLSRKRKMNDFSPSEYNELGISSPKRRKLYHCSNESLISIDSDISEKNQEEECCNSSLTYYSAKTIINDSRNQDTAQLLLELESAKEEIAKLEKELQNSDTIKVYEELRLRSKISELIKQKQKMSAEIAALKNELKEIKERVNGTS